MNQPKPRFNYRILVVDDDPSIREVSKLVLGSQGYEVGTASNGFEALVMLRGSLPDAIISDLKMPSMSGFEFLSVVRRRFPNIPVIAISGEYNVSPPVNLLADAYFMKAQYSPAQLFEKIAELIKESPLRPYPGKRDHAPVWFPPSTTGYYVLTCIECLRSFSLPKGSCRKEEVSETECIFCETKLRYVVERDP